MKSGLLLGAFLLFGCTTSPKQLLGPDGTEHKLLTCNEIESCYEQATKVCGKYKIVNTSNHTYGDDGKTDSYSKMLVKCEG